MSEPDNLLREAPPASEAPEIIYLPPPANDQPPQRKNGRAVSTKPGSQISRRQPVKDPLDAWLPGCRCTKAERAQADAAAAQAGISLNAYIRRTVFGKPGRRAHRSKPGPEAGDTARIVAALGRSGSNLNQLFDKASAYDFRGFPALLDMMETMQAAFAAHHELVAAIKEKLDCGKRRSQPGPDTDTAARMVADLNRSGSDLNRLLQKVNAYDFRGIPEFLDMCAEMKAAHAAHYRLAVAIKAELGI